VRELDRQVELFYVPLAKLAGQLAHDPARPREDQKTRGEIVEAVQRVELVDAHPLADRIVQGRRTVAAVKGHAGLFAYYDEVIAGMDERKHSASSTPGESG